MFAAAACAVLFALALAVVRALKGPTVFDRVLAGNSVGTLATLLLAVVGFLAWALSKIGKDMQCAANSGCFAPHRAHALVPIGASATRLPGSYL
jgi:hypothetical protein